MDKRANQALTALRMCESWKGHDFDVVEGARSSVGRRAKRLTNRARRRLDKAMARDEG